MTSGIARHRCRGDRDGLHRHRPRGGASPHRGPGSWRPRQHRRARRGPRRDPRRRAWRMPRWTSCSPTRPSTSSTSPRPTTSTSASRSRSSQSGRHVVCEKPLAMTSAESTPTWSSCAAASGRVNAVNFNIRYYPLNQHAHDVVAAGALGEVRLVTGRYFQDWLLLPSDWNWRLAAGSRRRAPRRRRHRLALARPDDVRHGPPDRGGDGRPRDLHPRPPGADRAGRDVLDRALGRDRRPARSAPRTPPRSCSASRAAPAARSASRRSAPAGRTRVQWEIDGSRVVDGLGLGAARPDLAGPPRAPQRDPRSRTRR